MFLLIQTHKKSNENGLICGCVMKSALYNDQH
ncbi:Uncharacterised protein [Vibrio cholerae]|nr:Uncharacterised protein [Vibrio cholerae]